MRSTILSTALALAGVAAVASILYFSLFYRSATDRLDPDEASSVDNTTAGYPNSLPAHGDETKAGNESADPVPHIRGRILDEFGFPIPGVRIHAFPSQDSNPVRGRFAPPTAEDRSPRPPTAVTDSEGAFRFAWKRETPNPETPNPGTSNPETPSTAATRLVLLASHPQFAPRILEHALVPPPPRRHPATLADVDVDIGRRILIDTAGLLVTVQSSDGSPINGATVTLRPALEDPSLPAPATAMLSRRTRSDRNGTATFFGVPGGSWLLQVSAAGQATAIAEHTQSETPTGVPRAVFTLEEGASLSGRVVDADGRGVRAARILSRSVRGTDGPTIEARGDNSGYFQLHGLARSRQRLIAFSDTEGVLDREEAVPTGPSLSQAFLELRLPRARSIEGQVRDAKTNLPIAGAEVFLHSEAGWPDLLVARGWTPSTRSDADGIFRFRGIPGGIIRLTAQSKGLCPAIAAPTWALPRRTGQPAMDHNPTAKTSPDGASVSPESEETAQGTVTLLLTERFSMEGRVLDPTGRPVSGARVEISTLSGSPLSPRESARNAKVGTRTDSGGRFSLRHTILGRALLSVAAPGFAIARTIVSCRADLVLPDVKLQRGGSVTGQALRRSGEPAADVTVYLVRTDDDPTPGDPEATPKKPIPLGAESAPIRVTCDPSGRFRTTDVAPGWYRVFYDDPHLQTPRHAATTREETEVRVLVESGRTRTLDLRPEVR